MANEVQVPIPANGAVVQTVPVVEPATHDYRAVQVAWFVVGLLMTLIAIRFVLKLLGASLGSGFVTGIYGVTDALVAPFRAIFPATSAQAASVDIAALVGFVVYFLAGWGVVSLVKLFTTPRGARSVS